MNEQPVIASNSYSDLMEITFKFYKLMEEVDDFALVNQVKSALKRHHHSSFVDAPIYILNTFQEGEILEDSDRRQLEGMLYLAETQLVLGI